MTQGGSLRVLIVGAGPAGVRAAETLLRHGIKPIVVDEAPRHGGQIYRQQPSGFSRSARTLYGFEANKAKRLHDAFDVLKDRIDYRPETLVWNLWQGVAHTLGPKGTDEIPFDALLLATGAMDRILPLPGWTLPGVYSMAGSQVALKYQACAIGRRVLFCGTGPLLYLVAYQYKHAGADVVAVCDTSRLSHAMVLAPGLMAGGSTIFKGMWYAAWLRLHGVPVLNGVTPLSFEGADHVEGLRLLTGRGRERLIACDAVGYGFTLKPETQLADLAGVPFRFEPMSRLWLPEVDEDGRSTVDGIYLAGDGASIAGADAAELRGELAALALLKDHGVAVPTARVNALRRCMRRLHRFRVALDRLFPVPSEDVRAINDEVIVCRCEAITAGEIRHAALELGGGEVNRVKALTRAGMGRCQARLCGSNIAELVAHARDVPLEVVGRLRGQAPVKPVPIALTQKTAATVALNRPDEPWSG